MLQWQKNIFHENKENKRKRVITEQSNDDEKRDTNREFVLLKPLLRQQHNQVEVIFINSFVTSVDGLKCLFLCFCFDCAHYTMEL
jgi:hypothetical protein